ncbi:hypothetical protein [Flavobacterium supellecticarium]|uniref:hypothetical protein n=1 Tax=Flavobacterium supellecticarium TaxID=2565924 RepID=UPI001454C131|nr:hypothetical protein [Flavobacterium supellecticarium]
MIHKQITSDNELYIWMNGKLLFKKWLGTQHHSKVFDVMVYGKNTYISITEKGKQMNP